MARHNTRDALDITLSADEAGKLFGITGRQIQALAADGVFPKVGHGRYRLGDVIPGYISTLRDQEKRRRIRVARKEYWDLRCEEVLVRIEQRLQRLNAARQQAR